MLQNETCIEITPTKEIQVFTFLFGGPNVFCQGQLAKEDIFDKVKLNKSLFMEYEDFLDRVYGNNNYKQDNNDFM